jgi:hypothetical protein
MALLSAVHGNGHAMDAVIADARVHGVDRGGCSACGEGKTAR